MELSRLRAENVRLKQECAILKKRRRTSRRMRCEVRLDGWDNAPTESWFNRFKNERVHGVRHCTREEMTAESFEYIEVFYNRKRLHSTLGNKSPIQFMNDWISSQQNEKQVA